MCGIAGALSLSNAQPLTIAPMLDALQHRGPDGEGEWSDGRCALGQRRLAIIDLSSAGQAPLSNEAGDVWVTFNGEIYNFVELRTELEKLGHRFRSGTDTEVIVHAYEQWGTRCVHRFRGMFAFAIWDQSKGRLFIARDRVGKKPLFYMRHGGDLLFASELQGLLALPAVPREPDAEALHTYLSWGYIPAPLTGFKGIKKLPAGHHMVIDTTKPDPVDQVTRYWDLRYSDKPPTSQEEAGERLRTTLTEAVRLRLISDVPLGAFLSGGIDSSIVVGLMASLSPTPIKTFSIGFEEAAYDELAHARRVAQLWGTDHHEQIVKPDALEVVPLLARHYGEPFADSSAIPTFYVSQMTRQHVTVALNGDGGDESFCGYDRYWGALWAQRLRRVPGLNVGAGLTARLAPADPKSTLTRATRFLQAAGRRDADLYARWMSYFTPEDKGRLCSADFAKAAGSQSRPEWFATLMADGDARDPAERAMSVDVRSYLPYDLLVKVDIASMANSLEGRSPFLDHEVMELAASLPMSMKLRGRSGKQLLKTAFSDLLPTENVNRPKMGFGVPVGEWFRGPLRDLLHDALLSRAASERGYFREAEVRRLVQEHEQGQQEHGAKLWNLLMLEMWHREVVDRAVVAPPS